MLGNWLVTITAIIVAILGLIAGLGLIHEVDNPDVPDDFKASDASQIASSFSANYSGFFGEDFYLADGESKAKAKDFYPNGTTGGYGSENNYVTFQVMDNKASAKDKFDTNMADYKKQIGKTVMGSVIKDTYAKDDLDGAIGYYNNFNMDTPSSYMYYTGYLGNAFFESYIYLKGKTITESDMKDLAKAICDAIKKPMSVDKAKRYVEPVVDDAPDHTNCWVYGNANMDNYVNADDIAYLKLIIAGKKAATAYADANYDGVIDDKDIQQVQDIIDGKGVKRYYTMDNGEVGFIRGQIKTLGAQYYANMYAIAAMGATGIVTCGDDETAKLANNGEFGETVKNQHLKNYGYTKTYEPETLLSMNVDAILCGTSYFKNWEEQYWNDGDRYIAFIRLACWTVDPVAAVVTVANLLENQEYVDKAVSYAEYAADITATVEDAVSGLSEKKSVLLIYPYKNGNMEFQGPTTGCYEASLMAGLDNLATGVCDPEKDNDEGFHVVDLEKCLQYDPDALIMISGCGWSKTQDDVNASYENYVQKFLKSMDAVKNGDVWFTSWRFTQGVFQPVGAIMMASEIYGSNLFPGMDAMSELQKYVDEFTSVNLGLSPGDPGYLDVTKTGMYFNQANLDELGDDGSANAGTSKNDPNAFDHLTTALWVYGNADNDSDLDADDIKFIRSIINKTTTWDPALNPYADVNYDGVVDVKDIAYLNNILNKKSCLLYYDQFWSAGGANPWEVSYIHYPYTSNTTYGVNYWEQADVMVLLDMWGQVTASESVVCMGENYAAKYPGVTNMYKLGALKTMDYETVIASGIDCLIGYVAADGTAKQIQTDLRAAGKTIDVIALPMSGVYCCKAVTTMGVLLGCEDAAKKYTEYNDSIVEYMKNNITNNPNINPASYVVVYSPKDSTRIEIEATNETTGMPCGGIAFIQLLPGKNIQPYGDKGSAYAYRSDEWFVTQNPDFIIISGATKTSAATHAEAEQSFKDFAEVFRATKAYADKNIIGCAYSMTTGYSAYASLVMMAVYMYPDAFTAEDEEYAWSVLQKWYDDFTYQDIDVKKAGGHVTKLGKS